MILFTATREALFTHYRSWAEIQVPLLGLLPSVRYLQVVLPSEVLEREGPCGPFAAVVVLKRGGIHIVVPPLPAEPAAQHQTDPSTIEMR